MTKIRIVLRPLLLGCASLAASAAALHCGASDPVSSTPSDDAGFQTTAHAEGGTGAETVGDGGALEPTHRSDGGTIDSGRDAGVITVCGGSKGNPSAVPRLDWMISAPKQKYGVALGVEAVDRELTLWLASRPVVSGEIVEHGGTVGRFGRGNGAFGTMILTSYGFASMTMPRTVLIGNLDRTFGWSGSLELLFNVRTEVKTPSAGAFAAAGYGAQVSAKSWTLTNPVRGEFAKPNEFYVDGITAERALGWFFTLVFDHKCKMQGLEALIGSANPLDILEPSKVVTRAEISEYLVDNDARLFLTVVTIGGDDPAVSAALNGTQASAATLDHLETTLTALETALDAFRSNAGPVDYASVTTATNPSWVIGSVHASPISDVPQ